MSGLRNSPVIVLTSTKITADGDCSHEIKRRLFLGRKVMTILKVKVKSLSRVQLFGTSWTVVYQVSPSMGSSRQKYWSGLPFPSPGDLPNPGIEPGCPALQADALPAEPTGKSYLHSILIIKAKTLFCQQRSV